VLNRTAANAEKLAARYRFRWGCLDEFGAKAARKFSDVIIQTTPAGMEGGEGGDAFPLYQFTGREVVYDVIYKPERTCFLKRAENAGCKVSNGYDMLVRQAAAQHRYFFADFPGRTAGD
jgi:3-dehydroquinate dehydratase/shikimate dehydrogenase